MCGRVRIRDDWRGDGPCHFSSPPSRYIEKNYHIMQIRARPVTLPAKGSRMATFRISRYLGKKKGGRRAEKRSFETRDPLDRDASACMRAVTYRRWNDDTESWRILRKRDPEKTRAIIIFGECRSNDTSFETSLIDCVEN